MSHHENAECDHGDHTQPDKKPALPAARIGQETEGSARVVNAHNIEPASKNGLLSERVAIDDRQLAQLIQPHQQQDQQCPAACR